MSVVLTDSDGLLDVTIKMNDGPKAVQIDVWQAIHDIQRVARTADGEPRELGEYWAEVKAILVAAYGVPVGVSMGTIKGLVDAIGARSEANVKKADPGPESPG